MTTNYWIGIRWYWVFASNFKQLRWLVAAALILSGCGTPAERARHYAATQNLDTRLIEGAGFQHRVFTKQGLADDAALPHKTLHIYLDGDGRPWLQGRFVSDDPTPKHPLALKLMAAAPYHAVYLGRPCYFGLANTPPCKPEHWTSARYGEEIITSLLASIRALRAPQQPLLLIGYSGGGTLATLLASRLNGNVSVLTVAANLDIDAWTTSHGYLPLTQSLNPIDVATLQPSSHQHWAGAGDQRVDSKLARRFAERHGGGYRIFPDFDHVCCWLEQWPQLLERHLNQTSTESP